MDSVFRLARTLMQPLFEGQGVVLMFHRVLPNHQRSKFLGLRGLEVLPNVYEEVLEHFQSRGFKFLSTNDLAVSIANKELPRKFVIVTFDDGYKDNANYVAEYMAAKKLPWTLYLTTGFCDRTLPCWWYGLGDLIAKDLSLDATAVGGQKYSLTKLSDMERNNIYDLLRSIIHERWTEPSYRDQVAQWFRNHNIDLLELTDRLAMSWDDAKRLNAQGCVIEPHTDQHLNLKHCDVNAAEIEIKKSRDAIEANLKKKTRTFAYPFGDSDSCGAREFELAKKCGFDLAFTTKNDWLNRKNLDESWQLPRINVSGSWDSAEKVLFRVYGWSTFIESRFGAQVKRALAGGPR